MSLAAATAARRRPGFAFEAVAPAADDALPRMDVPLLAGIAERGPLHTPVVVHDLLAFEAIFGGPAPLVWDPQRGEVVHAQLHAAVALFFANGGRRCWVLRVAHSEPLAEASRFVVPGLWTLRAGLAGPQTLAPLTLRAASPGRWADGLRVAASLEVEHALAVAVEPGSQLLSLALPGAASWVVGDLLRLAWPSLTAFVGVTDVARPPAGAVGPLVLSLAGLGWRIEATSPPRAQRLSAWPAGLPTVERLGLTLWWREGGRGGGRDAEGKRVPASAGSRASLGRLAKLGLGPGHERHVSRLPDDVSLQAGADGVLVTTSDGWAQRRQRWADALSPRWPLAGVDPRDDDGEDGPSWCLPLGVGALPDDGGWAPALHSGRAAIERDGLVPWAASIFTDRDLAASAASTLAADADALRLLARTPRSLTGLHAAWPIDEVSMLAVPDGGWPGWSLQAAAEPEPASTPPPPPRPAPPSFEACAPRSTPSTDPAPTPPTPTPPIWCLAPTTPGAPGRVTLRAVQRLMLRWVFARGDAMALLSLPAGIGDVAALAHREALLAADGPDDGVPMLLGHEHAALGLAALVHGGVVRRGADGRLQRCVADGAWAGLIARRSLARGAWIAPANEALRGVVALEGAASEPGIGALMAARVNLLAATPRGFVPLNADTLGAGAADDLRPIAARRLLQLLRRLALREGQAWVFEPHDGAFRRGVQRSLEALLRGLFERGAFAGRRAEDSYQVVAASEALNARASVDAGRFVVELRVAPAQPMSFVTLRLVRSGDALTID